MPAAEIFGDDTGTGGVIALAMALGGGISWLLTWLNGQRKDRRTHQIEDEDRDKARQDELFERVKADRDAAVKREQIAVAALELTRSQMIEIRLRDAVKTEHSRYLEGLLDEHQIAHRKWQDRLLAGDGQIVPHAPDTQDPQNAPDGPEFGE